ncbi:glycosyl hydrolase [Paenibacillus foliorum]|uniref:glycosyl hydrolase n=1 Tax=Paenibacillus foliorum TaxID=2654974 RepID=UPI0028AB2290|nr:glycosyl hydrolase [Paenibacillus foliorum]
MAKKSWSGRKGRLLHAAALAVSVLMLGFTEASPTKGKQVGEAIIYEAEDAFLSGTYFTNVKVTNGYSGTGYVSGFDEAGDSVVFNIRADETGCYPLTISYSSPFGNKTNKLFLNEQLAGEKEFPQTDRFTELNFGCLVLQTGFNRVELRKDWGYIDVDYIKVGKLEIRQEAAHVKPQLATRYPSKEAQGLMNYLTEQYGKAVIAGQQTNSREELDYILSASGKLPAMIGIEVTRLDELALEWAERGGLLTSEWHWMAPAGGYHYLSDSTTFDIAQAIIPGTVEHELVLEDIDRIAASLGKLKDAGIPVLWRPLHEAEGKWFWWGEQGPGPAKILYRLLFDRLVNYHGLDNLIWVWTSIDAANSGDWYPGDDYVDIVGIDKYAQAGNYGTLMIHYDNSVKLVNGSKLVALTENGPIPDPQQLQNLRVGWSYFTTWHLNHIMDGNENSVDHIQYAYNHPYVITLDKLPSEKIYYKDRLTLH